MPEQETNLQSLTFQAGTRAPALWYCIIAGIYKLISKSVRIIDFYDIDDVLYWLKYIFF